MVRGLEEKDIKRSETRRSGIGIYEQTLGLKERRSLHLLYTLPPSRISPKEEALNNQIERMTWPADVKQPVSSAFPGLA